MTYLHCPLTLLGITCQRQVIWQTLSDNICLEKLAGSPLLHCLAGIPTSYEAAWLTLQMLLRGSFSCILDKSSVKDLQTWGGVECFENRFHESRRQTVPNLGSFKYIVLGLLLLSSHVTSQGERARNSAKAKEDLNDNSCGQK